MVVGNSDSEGDLSFEDWTMGKRINFCDNDMAEEGEVEGEWEDEGEEKQEGSLCSWFHVDVTWQC